jgi:Fe-S-cluster containining protein
VAEGKDSERAEETARRLDEVDARFAAEVTEPVQRRALSLRGAMGNLKLARRYDVAPLQTAALAWAPEGARAPDCAACEDRCCADPLNEVALRLVDLWRLREADLLHGVSRAPLDPQRYEGRDDLRELEGRDSFRRFPRLAKKTDGSCFFLDDEGRCSIYALRPLQCRRFPWRLEDDGTTLGTSSRCGSCAQPLGDEGREAASQEVVTHYNAKLHDLVALEHGRRALAQTGLGELLPEQD